LSQQDNAIAVSSNKGVCGGIEHMAQLESLTVGASATGFAGSADLNLDVVQNRETENNLNHNNRTVDDQIKEAYCWLFVPYIDKAADMKTIVWDTIRISGGNDSIISKTAKKMLQDEQIITAWALALLLMELDSALWKNTGNIAIKKLWEYLCTYCYPPCLVNNVVLDKTIQTGLNSDQYFVFASGFDGTRYIDLKFNQYVGIVERSGYLVKGSVAHRQIADDEAKRRTETASRAATVEATVLVSTNDGKSTISTPYTLSGTSTGYEVHEDPVPAQPTAPKNRRFLMSADLDTTRINCNVQKYVEGIIQHLISVDGAKVKASLEVEAETDGFAQQTARTISENCWTLRVRDSGVEE